MTTQKQPDAPIHKRAEELSRDAKSRRSSPVALGKVNMLLALLALLVLVLAPVTVASRAWQARRGGLEYGLLRHPFRGELRPYLLQCLNHWLFLALFVAAILAGTFTTFPGLL